MNRLLTITILLASALSGQQKYNGPPPAKQEVPYLVQAGKLIETETAPVLQLYKSDATMYIITGDKSPVRTQLTTPALVVAASAEYVEKLRLFRLDGTGGGRRLTFHLQSTGGATPIKTGTTLISEGLYQITVGNPLPPAEYGLSVDGAKEVFCFEVF